MSQKEKKEKKAKVADSDDEEGANAGVKAEAEDEDDGAAAAASDGKPAPDPRGELSKFPLSKQTLEALKQKGITGLFPIQFMTFESVFGGKDVLARARTGTGKTLAFALPIIERVLQGKMSSGKPGRAPLAIVLAPTRELAIQIAEDFKLFAPGLSTTCVYGGASIEPQVSLLSAVARARLRRRATPRFSALSHLACCMCGCAERRVVARHRHRRGHARPRSGPH